MISKKIFISTLAIGLLVACGNDKPAAVTENSLVGSCKKIYDQSASSFDQMEAAGHSKAQIEESKKFQLQLIIDEFGGKEENCAKYLLEQEEEQKQYEEENPDYDD